MRKKSDDATRLGAANRLTVGSGDFTELLMLEAAFDAGQPFCERMVDRLADGLFRFDDLLTLIHEEHNSSLDDVEKEVFAIYMSINSLMKRYAD